MRAALAVLLLAPSPPLLFMGEEWGCEQPFPFFAHFGPSLAARVREGRRREFARFPEFRDEAARERIPDPGARETFESAALRWDDLREDGHREWLAYYRRLLEIRNREVTPRLARTPGHAAEFTEIGEAGLQVSWRLRAGVRLKLWAQLAPEPCKEVPASPSGRLLFATHDALPRLLERGEMPPWSAAWYLEQRSAGGGGVMGGDAFPANAPLPEVSTPTATYRLQFHAGFTLRDAERLVPYLHGLGVSHVYCAPYLKARAGSTHGYDITDHNALNPEVGDEESFSAFVEALHRHGMGQILDFVPNHVGIGGHENLWWLDVLEYGPSSPYAEFFDIDWEPAKAELRRKVLLPFLGDHYGQVLERGELELRFDSGAGSLSVWYHEHRFPITPRSYPRVLGSRPGELEQPGSPGDPGLADLRALLQAFRELAPPGAPARRRATLRQEAEEAKAALASLARARPAIAAHIEEVVGEINGSPGDRRSFELLHRLLEAQHYRLAYWRVAADEVNYRRFFDINELAGLRVDREDLFELTHQRVFEWIERGQVHGLRIDHIDGLADPRSYCQRIRQRFLDRRLYLVVEKILAVHEKLRPDWPVDGTTGYEFLNLVNGLLIDPAGERPLVRIYQRFADRSASFDDILYTSKKNAMSFLLGSELQVLANQLDRIAESDWRTRDFTLTGVKEALKEIIACFPVYRTYVSPLDTHPDDRREIERAVEGGRKRSSDPEPSLFHWIQQILAGDLLRGPRPDAVRRDMVRFITKFQQYTPPVMAKGLEDTSFYRHHQLVSLNEVGGDPRRFGISLEDFHAANQERAARWPRAHAHDRDPRHQARRGPARPDQRSLRDSRRVAREGPDLGEAQSPVQGEGRGMAGADGESRVSPLPDPDRKLARRTGRRASRGASQLSRADRRLHDQGGSGGEGEQQLAEPRRRLREGPLGIRPEDPRPGEGGRLSGRPACFREARRRAGSDEQPLSAPPQAHLARRSGHLPGLRALGPLARGPRQPKARGLRRTGSVCSRS